MLKAGTNTAEIAITGTEQYSPSATAAVRGDTHVAPQWLQRVPRALRGQGVRLALLGAIVVECIVFGVGNVNFLTVSDFRLILLQISVDAIVAVATTAVMIAGVIDLSFGAVIYLAGGVTAVVVTNLHQPVWLGIVAGIGSGMLVGTINGVASTLMRIPAFISTLAMLFVSEGVALQITGGNTIPISSSGFAKLGGGYVGPIPAPVIIMVCLGLLGWLWLNKTVSGIHVYETGSNLAGARNSGVRVELVRFGVLVLQGAAAGIAGVLLASRLSSATPSDGSTDLLQVIAAVVVGGTSLFGGKGSISGTMLGMIFIGILANGMVLINVSPNYQLVVMGAFILGAVWLQNIRRAKA